VELEASYYRKNWFLYAMIYFLMGAVAAMAMWATGQSKAGKVFSWITLASTLAGVSYCVIAIVKRCIIMQRPPVGNLYDTIIFIATTAVIFSLLLEWMVRRRFALGIAPIIGTGLIILARRFELGDAKDHMDPLVAVLDSNYWLTIHVITITLGYSAGFLSSFLSTGYVLMRGLNLDNGDQHLRRSLTKAVYGMVCFTLFLSLVGTVLGGIWANYSWGRFWGWDPKENGALLIVLWTLAILHARLGGYLREWGLHLASIFTAIVVTFSWWHVNFLGVGLHNYGFTAGKNTIWTFYGSMLVVLIGGAIAMLREKKLKVAQGS
jgi:ABC-type transport system involved in cytochrome c biogenesis permease subunit